jgi:hypothetical protein
VSYSSKQEKRVRREFFRHLFFLYFLLILPALVQFAYNVMMNYTKKKKKKRKKQKRKRFLLLAVHQVATLSIPF